jgi:hypothetical protein
MQRSIIEEEIAEKALAPASTSLLEYRADEVVYKTMEEVQVQPQRV